MLLNKQTTNNQFSIRCHTTRPIRMKLTYSKSFSIKPSLRIAILMKGKDQDCPLLFSLMLASGSNATLIFHQGLLLPSLWSWLVIMGGDHLKLYYYKYSLHVGSVILSFQMSWKSDLTIPNHIWNNVRKASRPKIKTFWHENIEFNVMSIVLIDFMEIWTLYLNC